jgi:cystathionine beta-synthase
MASGSNESIRYFDSVLDAVGNTPLIRLRGIARGTPHLILCKAEFLNPGGSVKDRIGQQIIDAAEKRGDLKPGGTIVEATSGNTGVGLAMVAALRGYKCIFTIPDKQSQEKVRLLKAYGAQVIVCPTNVPPDSPESYYEIARRKARETPNAILANQYFNPDNPEAHYLTTGPELWEQTAGQIDVFIAGAGTGGTLTGVGKYLKEKSPRIKIVAADPVGSILRDYFYYKKLVEAKPYKIEGIGEDIIPGNMHFQYMDEFIEVTDRESFMMTRQLAREEGILVGSSGGAALVAAQKYARGQHERKVIVVLLPDTGSRHLSKVHNDEWMAEQGYFLPERLTLGYILEHKQEQLPDLVMVDPDTTVEEAIALLRKYSISQMPVSDNEHPVGKVTENALVRMAFEKPETLQQPVRDLMEPPMPVQDAGVTMDEAMRQMGRGSSAVLVCKDGKMVGILSRYDFLDYLSARR